MLRSLCPTYPDDGPTITQAVWNSAQSIWQFMNGAFARSDWSTAGHGSNNWVVAPSRSATGRAILCNDPHLRLTIPSIWYLMHLKAETSTTQPDGYEVWGASIPGSPCVQLGHNRWISWGVTAARLRRCRTVQGKNASARPRSLSHRRPLVHDGESRRNHQSAAQQRSQKNCSINSPWAGH